MSRYVPPVLLFSHGHCFCKPYQETRVARLACKAVRMAGAHGSDDLRENFDVIAHSPYNIY